MPIYEYMCQSCQHSMEALQKMSDAPLVDCPECGKPSLKKQVTAAAFKLKGGGWYETDFKNNGQKPKADGKAESKASAGSESTTASKSTSASSSASSAAAKTADS